MNKHLFISLLAATLLIFPALGCDDGDGAAESASGAASEESGAQRVEVTVDASGYEPSEVQAKAGEPLTLAFTRTSDEGCGGTVVIASADIERELPLNQTVEVTFTPEQAGDVRFSCGMDMYDGKIVVR